MDSSSLLECADQAMYQAKHAGKNQFCYFKILRWQANLRR